MRDNDYLKNLPRIEPIVHHSGWTVAIYPTRARKKRRFIGISRDCLNFMKVNPSGVPLPKREAYLELNQVAKVRPVPDADPDPDCRHLLRVMCKPNALMKIVGGSARPATETAPLVMLELFFSDVTSLQAWAQVSGI